MRQHNGTILVTEPLLIKQFPLTTASVTLPNIPTGDAGHQILQVTLRSADNAWEFRFGSTGEYFWMAGMDVIILPFRDYNALQTFEFRAITTADMRIIYEA